MSAQVHTALDVASWFLSNPEKCPGEPITHLKLQKLVYYAQAWSLALLNEQLFAEDFEAWAHGPVAPSLYRTFSGEGWNPLAALPGREVAAFSESQLELLDEVAESYGAYGAKALERMTHNEDPWRDARVGLAPEARCDRKISKEAMSAYYGRLYAQDHGKDQ